MVLRGGLPRLTMAIQSILYGLYAKRLFRTIVLRAVRGENELKIYTYYPFKLLCQIYVSSPYAKERAYFLTIAQTTLYIYKYV